MNASNSHLRAIAVFAALVQSNETTTGFERLEIVSAGELSVCERRLGTTGIRAVLCDGVIGSSRAITLDEATLHRPRTSGPTGSANKKGRPSASSE